jgi:hypothetical protein
MNENQPTTRAELESDVLDQITGEVRQAILFHSPQSWTQKSRDAVEASVLDHSRLVLDALSTQELQSEGALQSHIAQAVADTKRIIRQGGAPRRES